jgi:glycosyltransferase involved in cell wall biosynthesis
MIASILPQQNPNGGTTDPVLRVTFLAVMPAPYMMDLFEAIHRDPRFALSVLFLERPAVAAPGVYWQEKPIPSYASVLPGGWFFFSRARVHINTGLFSALDGSRPDIVVVLGYSSLTCQLAMYWLSAQRIPWVFWGEVPGFEKRGILGATLRWLALRPVARMANGIAAIGKRAADAYSKLAYKKTPIRNIPYYCQVDRLLRIERASESSDDDAHFLFCGQIVNRKGVELLVRSFCRVANKHAKVRLTLVGDGPLRATLTEYVPQAIRDRVNWVGFKEADELAPYFAAANVFVLPSLHDGWGVVVNQAVSAGMAVIASDAVGAAIDLVAHGGNGLIFRSESEQELTTALSFFAENPKLIRQFGEQSRARGHELRPEHGADQWYDFCRRVIDGRCSLRSQARRSQCASS